VSRRDVGFVVVSCAALTVYNNVIGARAWHRRWYAPANAGAAAIALAAARADGLTAADLGLGPGAWRPGRLGCALATTVAAGYLAAAALPGTRPWLDDKRVTGLDRRGLLYQVAFRVPVGTVLWEEIAFRGVLQAALRRVLPEPAAIAVASGVFAVWHIRPTRGALRINGLAGHRGQTVTRVAGVVTATAAGGALFSWLRARSGSLTAPVLVHLTTNCGGLVVAWTLAQYQRRRRNRPGRPARTR
jgi:CAAX protease family protein